MVTRTFIFLFFITGFASSLFTENVATRCDVSLYTFDSKDTTINVRDNPNGKIAFKLPNFAIVKVDGYYENWFYISRVIDYVDMPENQTKDFKISGWIHKSMLHYTLGSKNKFYLYSDSNKSNSLSLNLNYNDGLEFLDKTSLLECYNKMIKIVLNSKKGWVDQFCGDPNGIYNCTFR